MENYYKDLASIDVSQHVEKKGRFSYLSWAWAVDQLRKHDHTATWEVKRFDGVPYLKTELGYFVEVEVTCKGIPMSQIHPVLDNKNKPIQKPSPFDINTSIQRALVKAIALHGLGLYIYAGEDLPTEQKPIDPITSEQVGAIKTTILRLVEIRNVEESKWYEALGIKDIEKLNTEQAVEVIEKLENWEKQAKENK